MLFRNVVFLAHVPLKCGKDIPSVQQVISALAFQVKEGIVGDSISVSKSLAVLWRYREVLQLLAEDDDSLLREKGILRRGWAEVGSR